MFEEPAGRRGRRTAALVLALAGALALLTAGCGGKSDDEKAREAYANSVCVAIAGWQTQVKSIATDLSAGISKASLQSKVTQIDAATKSLREQIKALPPPNTEQGKATKQQLDQLESDLSTTVASTKTVVADLQTNSSAANVAAAVLSLGPQFQGLAASAKTAVSSLKSGKDAMSSAFKNADSCKSLGSSS